jgi:hypothetical protein
MLHLLKMLVLAASAGQGLAARPRLHIITYATLETYHMKAVMMLHSAGAYGLFPTVLGVGEIGSWPEGLWQKIPFVQKYLTYETQDDDLVLFVDAYDVLFVGNRSLTGQLYKDEIINRYTALGVDIVFNAETVCAYGSDLSPVLCPAFERLAGSSAHTPGNTKFKYLNSGAWIGKVGAVKQFFKHPIPDQLRLSKDGTGDQMWYAQTFMQMSDSMAANAAAPTVALDYNCRLFQTVGFAEELLAFTKDSVQVCSARSHS